MEQRPLYTHAMPIEETLANLIDVKYKRKNAQCAAPPQTPVSKTGLLLTPGAPLRPQRPQGTDAAEGGEAVPVDLIPKALFPN
jgi:hypothetical protein